MSKSKTARRVRMLGKWCVVEIREDFHQAFKKPAEMSELRLINLVNSTMEEMLSDEEKA